MIARAAERSCIILVGGPSTCRGKAKSSYIVMGRLTCFCLNVTVHYKSVCWNTRPVRGSMVLPEGHRLCNDSIYEIDIDVAGVTTEHSSLLKTLTFGDWRVVTCVNCHCDVTVSHTEKNRLFVCPGLLATEEDIAQVKSHPHYSRVFRISLNPDLEDEPVISWPRVSSMSYGRDDPLIRLAHTQVKEFLATEEEAVERRIREFEKNEKDKFSRLQKKTFTQRTLLFAAIAKARRDSSDSQSNPSPSTTTSQSHTLKHSISLPTPSTDLKQSVTITLSDARPPRTNKPSVSDDALFSLDGFDDVNEEIDGKKEGVAFPQSDDEESGTDDSSYRDMSSVQSVIASSVPLAVPLFQPRPIHDNMDTSNETVPTDMASSIKALALSVQDTAVFGDLPRPRVNSSSKYK